MILSKRKIIPALSLLAIVCAGGAFAENQADFDKMMDAFLQKDDNVEKIGNALERFIKNKQEMAERKQLDEQFKNPVSIDVGSSPVRGKANAPITIVEFSDFQCPFCSQGMKIMEEVLKRNPDTVRVVFKNLPLPFHDPARPAAIAALAAGEQGKFWEMHDQLFGNQRDLSEAKYEEYAKKIGIDVEKFKKDVKSEELGKQVEADMALAQKLGVQGTPGFFVNGVQVRGARPADDFQKIIDKWLEMKKS